MKSMEQRSVPDGSLRNRRYYEEEDGRGYRRFQTKRAHRHGYLRRHLSTTEGPRCPLPSLGLFPPLCNIKELRKIEQHAKIAPPRSVLAVPSVLGHVLYLRWENHRDVGPKPVLPLVANSTTIHRAVQRDPVVCHPNGGRV